MPSLEQEPTLKPLTPPLEQSPNYPMQFMLNIYELPHLLSPESQPQQWPKTLEVDYVRGYRVARAEE